MRGVGSCGARPGESLSAGFWNRVAAWIIDGLVVAVLGVVVVVPMQFGLAQLLEHWAAIERFAESPSAEILYAAFPKLALAALLVTYVGALHASRLQATLGKRAIGIKVVRGNGAAISLRRSIARALVAALTLNATVGLAALVVVFSSRQRALHDMACDTVVVDRWAFTDTPEWQKAGLRPVAVVVLVLTGLLLVLQLAGVVLTLTRMLS